MVLLVDQLIGEMRNLFQRIPDPRTSSNTQFAFDDIGMAAFSVFFEDQPQRDGASVFSVWCWGTAADCGDSFFLGRSF